MKELYIAPEVKLMGFVAAEKMAAQVESPWEGFGITLSGGNTQVSETDIKIPITKLS